MAELWKGAPVAAAIADRTAAQAAALREAGIVSTLAMVRVGARADDLSYERGAVKRCEAAGVAVRPVALPEDVTQAALLLTLADLNADAAVCCSAPSPPLWTMRRRAGPSPRKRT